MVKISVQGRQSINQRISSEDWGCASLPVEDGHGAPARNKIPTLIGVASPFAARIEVYDLACLTCGFTNVAATTGARLASRGNHSLHIGIRSLDRSAKSRPSRQIERLPRIH